MAGIRKFIDELSKNSKLLKQEIQAKISEYFEDVAHELMFNHSLIVKPGKGQTKYKSNQIYKICEIEFYLKDE